MQPRLGRKWTRMGRTRSIQAQVSSEDVPDGPPLVALRPLEQERLRSRAANAMFQLVECSLASGAYQQGIEYGRKLLTLEPLWEQAQRTLMTLLAESGNRTAAVQVYDTFAKMLKKELDVVFELLFCLNERIIGIQNRHYSCFIVG